MKFRSFSELERLQSTSRSPGDPPPGNTHDGKGKAVRLSLDTKGRKGKSVTVISGLQHNPDTMKEIAKTLKESCGAGGTVKGREIELQGDQRERVKALLEEMGYRVLPA